MINTVEPNGDNGLHLQLPWPPRNLFPNVHQHWQVKARDARLVKRAGRFIAMERGVTHDKKKHYRVTLVFCPPSRRHFDRDNLLAAMKHTLDGMCQGLGIDDNNIKPVTEMGPVVGMPGKVEATIVEITDPREWIVELPDEEKTPD